MGSPRGCSPLLATERNVVEDGIDQALESLSIVEELSQKMLTWAEAGAKMIPNFILALLVIGATYVVVKVVGKGLDKVLKKTNAFNHPQLTSLGVTLGKIALWAAGLFVALTVLNLDKTVTSMLAGLGIIGLALGFAFKDLATNFMAGIMMTIRKPFRVGDVIEAKGPDITGKVEKIDLREVLVRKFDGELAIIPNKEVYENTIISRAVPQRRVSVEVGVSYGDDLEAAMEALKNGLEKIDPRANRGVEVFYKEFGGSSINLDCRVWIDQTDQPNWLETRSKMVIAMKRALDDANCTIPFPIRTLDFSGPVGADSLDVIMKNNVAGTLSSGSKNGANGQSANGHNADGESHDVN